MYSSYVRFSCNFTLNHVIKLSIIFKISFQIANHTRINSRCKIWAKNAWKKCPIHSKFNYNNIKNINKYIQTFELERKMLDAIEWKCYRAIVRHVNIQRFSFESSQIMSTAWTLNTEHSILSTLQLFYNRNKFNSNSSYQNA